jgi:hypothetical protein
MPIGPGKYDQLCTAARLGAKANGVVLIVVDGEHGPGFSVQGPIQLVTMMPDLLRHLADDIEQSLGRGKA